MIQFNLLPNVKLEYVKAKRNKRITIIIASLVASATLAVFILLFVVVQIIQKKHSTDLTKDIKSESSKLQQTDDLNKILTIQNQLNSLTDLHDQKPVATRLFTYLKQVTPNKVSIASINIDFDTQIISLTGSTNAISNVNVFVDTLKFTTFNIGKEAKGNAFSEVVLAGFGKDTKGASYQLTLKFDPAIFASTPLDPDDKTNTKTLDVSLVIPSSKVTTRSETEKPGEKVEDLFQPLSEPKTEEQ